MQIESAIFVLLSYAASKAKLTTTTTTKKTYQEGSVHLVYRFSLASHSRICHHYLHVVIEPEMSESPAKNRLNRTMLQIGTLCNTIGGTIGKDLVLSFLKLK